MKITLKIFVGLWSLQLATAQAAIIEVNTSSGEFTAGDGCSLPEAVTNANDNAATFAECVAGDGADQIEFILTTPATITLSAALPNIVDDLTIVGPGMDALSISGNSAVPIFFAPFSGPSGSLTLSDLELRDGARDSNGGAIRSAGLVTVNRVRFLNNTSSTISGGAIALFLDANLTVVDSEFIGNSAATRGGAIRASETAVITVDRTRFERNVADASVGGAIYTQGTATLTARQSLFVGNTSGNDGGAIAIFGGTATIESSTFSGSNARRGAVYVQGDTGFINLSTSTFANNSSTIGGAALEAAAGTIAVIDSLITQGTGTRSNLCDISSGGTMTVNAATLSTEDCFGASVVEEAGLNVLPLADNGGQTLTHALGAGSVAIDAIADCGGITEDQRGLRRPSGATGRCDAGAFEAQRDPPDASGNIYSLTEDDLLTGLNLITDDTGDGIDSDANGDELTVTSISYVDDDILDQTQAVGSSPVTVSLQGGGLLTIDETGAIQFDARGQYDELAAGDNLALTFSYTISDGSFSDTAAVGLDIAGVNDAPTATADTYRVETGLTLDVGVAQGLLANDSDIDGDLTVTTTGSILAGGIGGTFSFNQDGSFSYIAPGTVGTATLDYTVSDGVVSVNGQVTVTVTPSAIADLQISKSDGVNSIRPDDVLTYTIQVINNGPDDVFGALVEDIVPAQLSNAQWVCIEEGASLCANLSGSGNIGELVDLPNGSTLRFELTATVSGADDAIENTATVSTPGDIADPDLTNNSATDINQPDLIFGDGFESTVINAALSARQAVVSKASIKHRLAESAQSVVLLLRAVSQPGEPEQRVLIHARRNPLDGAFELQASELSDGTWTVSEWMVADDERMMVDW